MLAYIVKQKKKGSNLWVPVNKDPIKGEVLGTEAQEGPKGSLWVDACTLAALSILPPPQLLWGF